MLLIQREYLHQLSPDKPILGKLKTHTRNITNVSLEPLKPKVVNLPRYSQPTQPNELRVKQLPTKLQQKMKTKSERSNQFSLHHLLQSDWQLPTLTQPQRINLDMIVRRQKNVSSEPNKTQHNLRNRNNSQSSEMNPYQYTKMGFYNKQSMRQFLGIQESKAKRNYQQNSLEYGFRPKNLSQLKSQPTLQIFPIQISTRQNLNACRLHDKSPQQQHLKINPSRHTSFDTPRCKKQWQQLQSHNMSPYELGVDHHRVIVSDHSLEHLHAQVTKFESRFISQNNSVMDICQSEKSDDEILHQTSRDLLKLISNRM